MNVTAATVASWGKFNLPTGAELDLLEGVVAAVAEHVGTHYYVADPPTADQTLAMIMASARLWKRRSTPEGVQQFGDAIAVRISSIDPDVEKLLVRRWSFS